MCLALAVMLTGCAGNADINPSPTAGTNSPMLSPGSSVMPSATDNVGAGGMDNPLNNNDNLLTPGNESRQISTVDDALTASKELEDAVDKMTEIDDATAVAIGNMALVGIQYDSTYQGGLDDRIRGMVLERAKAIHPGIQSVAVTDDPKAFEEISALYDMLTSGSPYTTVKSNADTLADGMDMYKE